jgi:hypothetical protein
MLGPRGTYLFTTVPDDERHGELGRSEAGHGPHVGLPSYSSDASEGARCVVPNGILVFGYWPSRTSFFVGSETNYREGDRPDLSGMRTRSSVEDGFRHPIPIINKTWFFDSHGKVRGWLRARRIADAADGRGMLFRVTADSRIVTLDAGLKVKAVRHFVWKDGTTGDAVALWDDIHLGLFVRRQHVVLAQWLD